MVKIKQKTNYWNTVQISQTYIFDYYPFGMLMPGRSYSSTAYKYGFNGKEKDDEVKGVGNSLDFGARLYDSRLGRWFAVDPKAAQYTSYSPYHAMYDNPVIVKDNNGEENIIVVGTDIGDGKNRTVEEGRQMREHFLYSAINNHYNELQKQGNGERTKILLFSTGDDKEDDRMKQIAFDNGVAPSDILIVKSEKEIKSYIRDRSVVLGKKDPMTGIVYPNGVGDDLITDLIYVGHGSASGLFLRNAYHQVNPQEEWIGDYEIFRPGFYSQNPSLTFEMCRGNPQKDYVKKAAEELGKGNIYSAKLGQSTFYESRGNPIYQGGGMEKSDSNGNKESRVGNKPERSTDKGADNVLFNPRF